MNDTESMNTADEFPAKRAKVSIYFAAGINVSQRGEMFRSAMHDISQRCITAGIPDARVSAFYPYGHIDDVPQRQRRRFVTKQVSDVFSDMIKKASRTKGGSMLYRFIRRDYDEGGGGNIVLIGHSGGGVASYKAAQLLENAGYPVTGVIMVGSPRLPIRRGFRDRVCAVEHTNRWGDIVCRCGFHWFQPPRTRVRLPIVSGHPFYFNGSIMDESGVSNLNKLLDSIWGWLHPTGRLVPLSQAQIDI